MVAALAAFVVYYEHTIEVEGYVPETVLVLIKHPE